MATDTRPNVLIFYADDLGWGDVGCFGAEDVQTPHLDQLRASGVRLPQWYSNSPVCSPSRASLLTGKYPARAGVEQILGGSRRTPGLPPQPTLASHLRDRGYRTGIFGKWHLGAAAEFAPQHYGFEESFGFRAGCVDYYSHIFYWGSHAPVHDLWQNDDEVWLNGEYLTTVIGERAREFISSDSGRPFFCYVPFNAPHYPMHAPAEYMERFSHLPNGRATMAAMIAALDDAIGGVLETLEEHGLRENTLVFMSSDNGPSAESRNWLGGEEIPYDGGSAGGLRGSKGSLFEGGIRVPTMVSWPAQLPAGADFQSVGTMMDVLPTVLHAVDGAPQELPDVDGVSLLDRLMDPATPGPDPGDEAGERLLLWTYDGQVAVRRGRYKLVCDAREGMDPPATVTRGLFDLVLDPWEQRDLSAQQPHVVAELEAALAILLTQQESASLAPAHGVRS